MTKKRNRKGIILRLLTYLFHDKYLMALALIITFIGNYINLLVPRYSGNAVDAISAPGGVDFAGVFLNCRNMMICVVISVVLTYTTQRILIYISASITNRMRKQVFDHLMTMPVSFFDQHQAGDIISRISYDINTINTSLSGDLIMLLTTAITVVGSFIMMVRISPRMCIIFFFTTPMILLITRQDRKSVV